MVDPWFAAQINSRTCRGLRKVVARCRLAGIPRALLSSTSTTSDSLPAAGPGPARIWAARPMA